MWSSGGRQMKVKSTLSFCTCFWKVLLALLSHQLKKQQVAFRQMPEPAGLFFSLYLS